MLTKAKPISLYQPMWSNMSILILGKTPLGSKIKKITATVLRTNQITPLIKSARSYTAAHLAPAGPIR